jgi:flagellar biosynthesis anti-sigma factor FlgM
METGGKSPLIGRKAGKGRLKDQDQQAQRRAQAGRESDASPDAAGQSAQSRKMQHLDELIESTTDVRTALVEQFRRSIEDGTYVVNSKKLAERILGSKLINQDL